MRLRNIPEAKEIVDASPYAFRLPLTAPLFVNDRPVHIEIGMGKGAFLLSMAASHPEINFLGVERYESVLFRAVEKMDALAASEGGAPENVRFLCEDASRLPEIFGRASVGHIYLNFSDPWPKARHAKRRLTSPHFLEIYEKFLVPGGGVTFKTDNQALFAYSLEVFEEMPHWTLADVTHDLHRELAPGEENIMTEYEVKFSNLQSRICRLKAIYEP